MTAPPTLTVGLPNFGAFFPLGEWHRFVELARVAEDAGVDRIVLVDHVVMGPNTDAYSWGKFPTPPDAPWLEPLTLLAAMAAITTRVRLATGILIAPLRPAALLAKQAATLDVVAQGRLDLGVGTGWQREEYEAEGLDFAQRGQLLTDTLAACKALWRDTPAALDAPTLSFRDIYCEPKPVQAGGVPLWIGGVVAQAQPRSPRALRRRVDPDHGRVRRRHRGRRPGSPRRVEGGGTRSRPAAGPGTTADRAGDDGRPDIARSMESVGELVAAGATDIHVFFAAFCRDPGDAPRVLDATRDSVRFRDVASPRAHTSRRLSDPPDRAADRAPGER